MSPLEKLFENIPLPDEPVHRDGGRIRDSIIDTAEDPTVGAVIPINQNGVKPGPQKFEQFMRAMLLGRVPTRPTPILSGTIEKTGKRFYQFTEWNGFRNEELTFLTQQDINGDWAGFLIRGSDEMVHNKHFSNEDEARNWIEGEAEQSRQRDKQIVWVKFFDPCSSATWFVTDWQPEDKTIFGYADIMGRDCAELGYSSLEELANIKGKLGIGIEIDNWFEPKPLWKAKQELYREKDESDDQHT